MNNIIVLQSARQTSNTNQKRKSIVKGFNLLLRSNARQPGSCINRRHAVHFETSWSTTHRAGTREIIAPKAVKQSAVPRRDLAPLRYVGIDVKHLPSWKRDHPIKALNIVCRASGLQHMYPFRETKNSNVIGRLYRQWTRSSGRPRFLKFDANRCNL